MKSLSLSIGGILLAVNVAILMLMTNCTDIVVIVSSSVILTTFLLTFTSSVMPIKDGFKVFLPFLFIFNGIIEYILSFFVTASAENVKNEWFLIAIILLFVVQLLCLILINSFSRHG